jgi:glutamate N-acetyltransferase/amino-acid N-acetyltransferase
MKLIDGGVTAPQGFTASGVCAGIKVGNTSKKDVAIICSQVPCTAAGVFTTNVVRAACIDFNKKQLADGKAQAIIVNSGNANACTGAQGMTDTEAMADVTAQCLKIAKEDILTASTG